MLTIRQEQMAVFERATWRDFIDRAMSHAGERFANQIAGLDPSSLRASIETALQRARQHGFEGETDLFRYLDLTFSLGSDFDRDRRRPWVQEILNARSYSPHTKMDLLSQLAAAERIGPVEEPPTIYDDEPEAIDQVPETPDEEITPLDDEVADFEPESEEPEQLPEDVIILDEEPIADEPAEELTEAQD